ncbi:MAG: MATE family efflux transporter [Actinocrinis sp.]
MKTRRVNPHSTRRAVRPHAVPTQRPESVPATASTLVAGESVSAREILRLAVPALGALIAEPLFLLADSAIVGHLGAARLAGLGTSGTALSTLVNVCVFLAYNTTAQVARLLGAGDRRGALARGVDGVYLAAALGVLLAVAGAAFAPQIVHLLGATPAATPYATTYLRVSCLGLPSMLAVLAATGLLRGLQDTRTPLIVAAAAALLNTLLNWILVYPAGLGIAGSALGTVLVQTAMAAVYLAAVARAARKNGVPLRPNPSAIRATLGANLALFARTAALRAYFIAAVWTAGTYGTTALAAHTIATNLWLTLALALDALAIAAQALVGRELGSGHIDRVRATVARMVRWGLVFGLATGLLLWAARPLYVPLFTPDHAVRDALTPVLALAALFQPSAGAVFVLDGVLIGAGDAAYLAWAALACTGVFLAGLAVLHTVGPHTGTGALTGLWLVIGVFTLSRWIALALRTRTNAWLRTGAF